MPGLLFRGLLHNSITYLEIFKTNGKKYARHIELVPIKTLQSLHAKFSTINESCETNLDCNMK